MSRSRCAHRHLQLLNFWPEVAGAPTVTTCAGKHCMASPCPAPAFLPTAVLSPACPTCSEVPAYLELLRRAAAKGVHPQVRPGSLLHRMSHPAHLLSALATTCTPGFGWQRRCMYGSPPTAFWPHTLQTVGGTCHTAQQPLTDKGLLPCPQLLLVDGFGVLRLGQSLGRTERPAHRCGRQGPVRCVCECATWRPGSCRLSSYHSAPACAR